MTDADTLEMVSNYAGSCTAVFSVYLTVTFAFLTIAIPNWTQAKQIPVHRGLWPASVFRAQLSNGQGIMAKAA
jgi:hypothetical protein